MTTHRDDSWLPNAARNLHPREAPEWRDEDGTTVEKLLYKPLEAAAVLGIGRSTLFALLARGEIASVRIGASRRIPASALADYVRRLVRSEGIG